MGGQAHRRTESPTRCRRWRSTARSERRGARGSAPSCHPEIEAHRLGRRALRVLDAGAARLGRVTDPGRRRAGRHPRGPRRHGRRAARTADDRGAGRDHAPSPQPMWPIGARGITPAASAREWYVFVLLGKDVRDRPRCWVVPRVHAVAGAWIAHMHWLTEPAFRPDNATHRSRRHASASTSGIVTKNGGTCSTTAPMTRR